LARKLCHLVEIDPVIVPPHAIGYRLEPAAGHVDRRAVREMAASGEIEAMKTSPGAMSAMKAAALAEAPECGGHLQIYIRKAW